MNLRTFLKSLVGLAAGAFGVKRGAAMAYPDVTAIRHVKAEPVEWVNVWSIFVPKSDGSADSDNRVLTDLYAAIMETERRGDFLQSIGYQRYATTSTDTEDGIMLWIEMPKSDVEGKFRWTVDVDGCRFIEFRPNV